MPNDRMTIMGEAEWAKECFVTEPSVGRLRFDELLKLHGNDGMVHFRFAEALEQTGESRRALEHFKRAQELFFMSEWRRLAAQGIERCNLDQLLSKLPKDLHTLWREVLAMQRSPFRARAVVARAAVQRTAQHLAGQHERGVEDGLAANLGILRSSRKFNTQFLKDLDLVKQVGDPAAHGADVSEGEYLRSFEASERVVEFLVAGTYLEK